MEHLKVACFGCFSDKSLPYMSYLNLFPTINNKNYFIKQTICL
jgi:hypothetical protein